MKIYLSETEVLELASDYLDLMQPNPDRIHEISEKMNMVYDENLDLFEDVEEISLRKSKQFRPLLKDAYHALQSKELNTPQLRTKISNALTL